ncbi:MAG: TspO/MBR family protein [Candidatus Hodarchaeota archaeon]
MEGKPLSDWIKAPVSIISSLLIGFAGNIFNFESLETWYPTLIKPDWTPPNWIFAPVWSTLFILMGISTFLVWREGFDKRNVKIALGVYVIQFALNLMWSWAFFGLQSPLFGFIIIVVLWIAIFVNIVVYARVSKVAAAILIPYIVWVTIASLLNFSVYVLNP